MIIVRNRLYIKKKRKDYSRKYPYPQDLVSSNYPNPTVGGGFLRVATCLWRCDFARPGFVLGKSTRNLTLGRINQRLPVYFWVYKINKTQSLRIMIIVEINNMISMIALIKWWVYMLLLCILSNVQY